MAGDAGSSPRLERIHGGYLDALLLLLRLVVAPATLCVLTAAPPTRPRLLASQGIPTLRHAAGAGAAEGLRQRFCRRPRAAPLLPPLLPLPLLQLRQAAVQQGSHQRHLGPEEADDAALAQRHACRHQPLHRRHHRLCLQLVAGAAAYGAQASGSQMQAGQVEAAQEGRRRRKPQQQLLQACWQDQQQTDKI